MGAAASAVTVVTATGAEAAPGQPILQGLSNNAGTAGTTLISAGSGITLTVRNNGAGAGAFFFAQNNNGFAGGTGAGSKYGLSAANTGSASSGAGMAASGINNTGVLANTANVDRYAVEATNLSTTSSGDGGAGGGIWADGGDGVGIAALSPIGVPAVVSIGDTYYIEGHEVVLTLSSVVYGVTSANGPEVTFSGQITLNGSGAGAATLDAATVADVDLTEPVSLVSPITGPMPNLWISTSPAGVVSVAGGAAGGTVSYRVIGVRNDWSIALDAADTKAKRTTARAKSLATALLKRAGR
ncbi:hypothetical protein N801_02455 [Knoellia aerolata DSM 18566]|uniref:Uncharacterized protein n=1 Tax=Knoellia aerolata DSM 18566 TaxID=1385519 RepID=A0A0A0K2V4_9MICO|nr:hypothetical protein N801_02455 [Knoellia aerolata DSM 18566]